MLKQREIMLYRNGFSFSARQTRLHIHTQRIVDGRHKLKKEAPIYAKYTTLSEK